MTTCYYYKAFNLIIKSEELIIDELLNSEGSLNPDIIIKKSNSNEWPKLQNNQYSTPVLSIVPGDIRLDIKDICIFRILNGKYILWDPIYKKVNLSDIKTFLLGSPLGALLIQKNYLVMHGNALTKDNKAIICLGKSGQGKSTIAYILMKKGWKLLSDDIVAINEKGYVLPGIPRIKLWLDALQYFKIDQKTLKKVRDNLQKYVIKRSQLDIETREVKLENFFIINRSFNKYVDEENLKIVSSESEMNTLLHLKNYYYRPIFVKGLEKEALNFLNISKLLKKVKLSILPVPDKIEKLSAWINHKKLF